MNFLLHKWGWPQHPHTVAWAHSSWIRCANDTKMPMIYSSYELKFCSEWIASTNVHSNIMCIELNVCGSLLGQRNSGNFRLNNWYRICGVYFWCLAQTRATITTDMHINILLYSITYTPKLTHTCFWLIFTKFRSKIVINLCKNTNSLEKLKTKFQNLMKWKLHEIIQYESLSWFNEPLQPEVIKPKGLFYSSHS